MIWYRNKKHCFCYNLQGFILNCLKNSILNIITKLWLSPKLTLRVLYVCQSRRASRRSLWRTDQAMDTQLSNLILIEISRDLIGCRSSVLSSFTWQQKFIFSSASLLISSASHDESLIDSMKNSSRMEEKTHNSLFLFHKSQVILL